MCIDASRTYKESRNMRLIKQDGPYCLVTSAAMVLDVTPDDIHHFIGHKGTDIWWPPHNMRGIHIQEIQEYALSKGHCFWPYELDPKCAPGEGYEPKSILGTEARTFGFMMKLSKYKAILITDNHAVAWDTKDVHDPKGFMASINDYKIREGWFLGKVI